MTQITLPGGFYQAKSLIAGAQRCVNLFTEKNQEGSPAPVTNYPRYGLQQLIPGPGSAPRGAYRATTGVLYEVLGPFLIFTDSNFNRIGLGTISNLTNPVSMSDNGNILVVVDGATGGWWVDLATNTFHTITDAAFYGSTRVEYMDTYFVFNRPGTKQFYLSPPNWNGTDPFDALDIASKVGGADNLVAAACNAGNIQLIGLLTTEIWYNNQGTDFTFARVPSVFIEHGTPAPYSVCQNDVGTYILSQDDDGGCIFLKIVGYEAQRFSTHAIENLVSSFTTLTDCVGQTYQYEGHAFVKFTFPTDDHTLIWDESQQVWHEETWTDVDGQEHQHRGRFHTYVYGKTVCQDWFDGALYNQDPNTFVDQLTAGDSPIVYRRGFPHLVNDGKRMVYSKFIANMQVAGASGLLVADEPLVSLRWSDTRGYSWGDPITAGMGSTGQYERWVTYWQLGIAQDRVFELFWSAPYKTALMGAFIDVIEART